MNKETINFIHQNIHADVKSLALMKTIPNNVDISAAIKQIEGWQKVKNKVPHFINFPDILYPRRISIEQCSSETTAKYKASLCTGKNLVDLTGGFGIDCCFLSDNFSKTYYIENDSELCTITEHNFIKVLKKSNIEIIHNSAEKFLETDFYADWIYIDPARRKNNGTKAVLLRDCEPNLAELQHRILSKTDHLMIKLSPMFDITQLKKELNFIKEIHILAVENECKEILVIMKKNYCEGILIKAIHFPKNKTMESICLSENDEINCISSFTNQIKEYLYEPNTAILKAGAFKYIGSAYNVNKLHKNSHLYTSSELISDFPGRIIKVTNVINFNKQNLKQLKLHQANVIVRNFPLNVDELRKKLKIKDGGSDFLYATTIQNENKIIIEGTKITL